MKRDRLVEQHGAYSQPVQDYDEEVQRKKDEAGYDLLEELFNQSSSGSASLGPTGVGRTSLGETGQGCAITIVAALFAVGMVAMFLHEPETDGIRPAGVSQTTFERNPIAGKVKIEKCGRYYKYGYGRSRPYTYTYSPTPPHAEIQQIVEAMTRGIGGRVLSSGGRIPRDSVMPIAYGFGNYIIAGGEKIHCSNFYYTPPSTASAAERRLGR